MEVQLSTDSPGSRSPVSLASNSPSAHARPRHAALALEACRAFSEGRWDDCIGAINELRAYIPQRETVDEEGNESVEPESQASAGEATRLAVNEIVARRESGALSVVQTVKELDVLYTNGKESQANDNLDICDQTALLYNMALAHFLRKQYLEADKLLKKLLATLLRQASSSPGGSSVGSNNNSVLHSHVYPLLVSISLALRLPTEALSYLGQSLATDGSQSPTPSLSGRQLLCRAHALILSRQHKPFKRDLKPVGLTPDETVAFEFMRANMEFLKGNHKKSTKLLALAIKNRKYESVPLDIVALYQNNIGCLHVMINKPNLATHYLTLALHEHENAINEESFSQRADVILQVKQFEITYNLGLALLHSRRYVEALKMLLKTVKFLKESPHLWYHMAECCIMACSRDEDSIRELQKLSLNPNKSSLISGGGRNQQAKRGALASNLSASSSPVTEEMLGDSDANSSSPTSPEALTAVPRPSMLFACLCLRNASSLIEKRLQSLSGPNELPVTTRLGQLKAAVLAARSFVSLCMEDFASALVFARQLLRLDPAAPSGYAALAHLYAAEALICMERVSEAVAHLEPKILHDVSFEEVREASDETGGSPVVANSAASKRQAQHVNGNNNNNNNNGPVSMELLSTRALFTFNLALAQLLRGESERAEEMLDKLWGSASSLAPTSVSAGGPGHCSFVTRLIMAKLFVNLRKGNVKKCREIVRQTCGLPATTSK